MCKKSKFDHTTKWYMHKPESVIENVMHKILWDFEIQADHLILARRPNLEIINKKKRKKKKKKENLPFSGLWHPSRSQSENQRKGKERQVIACEFIGTEMNYETIL